MHSALKKDGRALYEYARAGVEVEREPREVLIHELSLAPAPGKSDLLRMIARVSKGTYIRTLGEDIGEALGCCAHLASLRRTATGEYQAAQCVTLEAFEAMSEQERLACLRPVDSLLARHMRVALDANDAGRFLTGLLRRGAWADNDQVAVYGPPPSPQPSPASGRGSGVYGPTPASGRGSGVYGPTPASGRGTNGTGSHHPLPLAGEGRGEGCLLGTAHIKGGELIPVRLLSPPEISQILESKQ